MAKKVLLTGGAGFIGSHTYAALRAAGYDVTVLDNFENADRDVPSRLAQIAGVPTLVIEADIRDRDAIDRAFADHGFDAVVHFAAKKSVPESEADPVGYYEANCGGLVNIVAAMRDNGVNTMVFSSSASVYGDPDEMPIREDTAPDPLSAYAATKLFGEQMLQRVAASHSEFKVGILRYFNPVGAHPSGLIGEDPQQTPTNLVPILAKVARGEMPAIKVFGSDYPTPDGTGIRDYIHVMDLARGHVLSLDRLFNAGESHLVNLGTGRGHSVLEVLKTYSGVLGRDLPFEIVGRRPGDTSVSFAETSRARELLGFEAEFGLKEMCDSNWMYFVRNKD